MVKRDFRHVRTMAETKQVNPISVALFLAVILLGTLASALTGQF